MNGDTNATGRFSNDFVRRMIHEPDWKTLEKISGQAKEMLDRHDYNGVGRLLRRYSESEKAVSDIALLIYKSDLNRTPEQAADKNVIGLFRRLSETYLVRNYQNRLSDGVQEKAELQQVIAAKHTFMLNHYAKTHPDSRIEIPDGEKVKEAVSILDNHDLTKEKVVGELHDFLTVCQPPSMYVQLRYGLADDYRLLRELENDSSGGKVLQEKYGTVPDYTTVDARLTKAAEKAYESVCKRPPNHYLDRLNEDLEKLRSLAANPKRIDDLFIFNDFLVKYGIDRDSPEAVRVRQAETAFRELDARFVRMTGREPYADEQFVANRQKADNTESDGNMTLRNIPKGRRMGL